MLGIDQSSQRSIFEPEGELVDDAEQAALLQQLARPAIDDAGLRRTSRIAGLDMRQGAVEILAERYERRTERIGGRKKKACPLDRSHAIGADAIGHPGVGQGHPNTDIDADGSASANTRRPHLRDRVMPGKLAKRALDRRGRSRCLHHGGRPHF